MSRPQLNKWKHSWSRGKKKTGHSLELPDPFVNPSVNLDHGADKIEAKLIN